MFYFKFGKLTCKNSDFFNWTSPQKPKYMLIFCPS